MPNKERLIESPFISDLSLDLHGLFLLLFEALAKAIVDHVEVHGIDTEMLLHGANGALDDANSILEALLLRLLLDEVDLRVDIDNEHVAFGGKLLLAPVANAMVVLRDGLELGARDVRLSVGLNASVGSSHHGNDHVEDDQHRDERANEEDEPEDEGVEDLLFVSTGEVLSEVKVSVSQTIRVSEALEEAIDARVFLGIGITLRIHGKQPEEERLSEDNHSKHARQWQSINDDCLNLAHEVGEEVEDLDSVEELEYNQLNCEYKCHSELIESAIQLLIAERNCHVTSCKQNLEQKHDANHNHGKLEPVFRRRPVFSH